MCGVHRGSHLIVNMPIISLNSGTAPSVALARAALGALTPHHFSSILRLMSRARIAAVLVFSASLVLAALIVTDIVPQLRGPLPDSAIWHWPFSLRPLARWWPSLLAALALLVVGVWWTARRPDRAWPVLLVAGLSLAMQLGLLYADRPNVGAELVDRTLSKDTNGYAAVAGEIEDLDHALRQFPVLMPTFDNEHARTHPPGLIAAYWLGDRTFRLVPGLADWLARPVRFWRCTDLWVLSRPTSTAAGLLAGSWLPIVSASLVPIAALWVARRLVRGQAIALAATLAAVIPALLVFAPTPDQVFSLLSLVSLWLILKGLGTRRWVWTLAGGIVISLMTMLSIGNLVWAGLLMTFALLSSWRRGWPARDRVAFGAALGAGIISLWAVYWLIWGVAPWSVVTTALDQHYELVTSLRDYATWLAYNPLDFLLFTGLAVIVGWGGLLLAALLRPGWRASDAGLLALLLAAVMLLLALSGGSRGEVGRLWLVYMPLAAVLAGAGWSAAAGTRPLRTQAEHGRMMPPLTAALLLGAQLLLVLSIGLAWRPLQAIILPVERPEIATPLGSAEPAQIEFVTVRGEVLRLQQASVGLVAGPELALTTDLVWASDGPTLDPYTVFVHVLDDQGNLVAQQDNWPGDGKWPTTCWQPSEAISDSRTVALPAGLTSGPYTVLAGLYDGTGTRLQTTDGADAIVIDRLQIGP